MKHLEALIVHRAEGAMENTTWEPGTTRVFSTRTSASIAMRLAARGIKHEGYDKFDLEIVYSDGSRSKRRVDVTKRFNTISEEVPELHHP